MPVVLDDEMLLIPPSMRRPRHYIERERIFEVASNQSTSTIDLPPHRVEYERPHSPLVIHQEDHIIQLPLQEVALVRGREYVIEPAGGRVGRYYHRSGARSETDFRRQGRARSVDYDAYDSYCSSCDEEEYYIDDGFTRGSSRSVMAGDVIGGGLGWRRRIRRSPAPTLGAQRLYQHHHGHHEHHCEHLHEHIQHSEKDPNRHVRHLAELGLGIAAVGAAKEIHDHAKRARSRSSGSFSDEGAGHTGRHITATALGATAAALAAHNYAERRRRGSSPDRSSDSGRSRHRGRKIVAGLGAATAAGLAAKAIHNRQHRGSRSRSRSSSASSAYSAGSHYRMSRAVGGATAFHRSRSRSHSRPGMLRHRRSSSASSTSSADSSSHKFRKAALGAGAVAGAAALARHAKHHRERSRSRSGIPRHRSRTVSPSRHRSSSRGASLAKAAAVTTVGALAQHQIRKSLDERRSLSVDAVRRRRRHREHGRHHIHHDDDSSVTHSRRGSGVGGMLRRAITGDGGGHHSHLHGLYEGGSEYNTVAQEMAYRVGEAAAAGVRRATSRPRQ